MFKFFNKEYSKKNKKSYKTLLEKISINIFLQFCIKYGIEFLFCWIFVWDGGFGWISLAMNARSQNTWREFLITKALKSLYLYSNQLSGSIPSEIGLESNPNIKVSKPNVVCDTFAAVGDVIYYFFQSCESLPDLIRKCGKKNIDDAFQRVADEIVSEI